MSRGHRDGRHLQKSGLVLDQALLLQTPPDDLPPEAVDHDPEVDVGGREGEGEDHEEDDNADSGCDNRRFL